MTEPASIRRLLCATDLSPAARPAWDEAQLLARVCKAEVVVLHVVAPVILPFEAGLSPVLLEEVLAAERDRARDTLDRLVSGPAEAGLRVVARVDDGSPARRILDVAREESADLVVMGTHGRTGLGRILLGSVADRVVRLAPCPVLTVPAAPEAAAVTPRVLRRLCYATDFSEGAGAAWPWVLALAGAAGAEIDLVHVMPASAADAGIPAEMAGRIGQVLEEWVREQAERLVRDCPLPPDRVRTIVDRGAASERVLYWANARGADLVVLGTRGGPGFLRWTLGSVAHRIVQTARRPVLTVGPASEPGPASRGETDLRAR